MDNMDKKVIYRDFNHWVSTSECSARDWLKNIQEEFWKNMVNLTEANLTEANLTDTILDKNNKPKDPPKEKGINLKRILEEYD